jgi:hypothetical protein
LKPPQENTTQTCGDTARRFCAQKLRNKFFALTTVRAKRSNLRPS